MSVKHSESQVGCMANDADFGARQESVTLQIVSGVHHLRWILEKKTQILYSFVPCKLQH